MLLAWFRQVVEAVRSNTLHSPRGREEFLPVFIVAKGQMCRCMMGNVLHSLEPIIGIPELGNDKSVMGISVISRILEPVLVTSKLGLDFNGMVKALAQVAGEWQDDGEKERKKESESHSIGTSLGLNGT